MVLEPVRCEFDEQVFASEMATNGNNRSIAVELNKRGIIGLDPDTTVDVYTRYCSMLVTTEDAALMAATMANKGKNPVTYEQVFEPSVVEQATTVMMSCGACPPPAPSAKPTAEN
jgi:glutaminase